MPPKSLLSTLGNWTAFMPNGEHPFNWGEAGRESLVVAAIFTLPYRFLSEDLIGTGKSKLVTAGDLGRRSS